WQVNVPHFGRVQYANVYPGIDLVYHGNQRQVEYDFVVAPGANPGAIQMAFSGTIALSLDAQGNLVLSTPGGNVVQQAPVLYQLAGSTRQTVTGGSHRAAPPRPSRSRCEDVSCAGADADHACPPGLRAPGRPWDCQKRQRLCLP